MVEYQNIFTQVQVQGPPEMGLDRRGRLDERTQTRKLFEVAGAVRQRAVGADLLGHISVSCRWQQVRVWFLIIGISFLAQVDYSIPLFLKELLLAVVRAAFRGLRVGYGPVG